MKKHTEQKNSSPDPMLHEVASYTRDEVFVEGVFSRYQKSVVPDRKNFEKFMLAIDAQAPRVASPYATIWKFTYKYRNIGFFVIALMLAQIGLWGNYAKKDETVATLSSSSVEQSLAKINKTAEEETASTLAVSKASAVTTNAKTSADTSAKAKTSAPTTMSVGKEAAPTSDVDQLTKTSYENDL